MKEDIVFSINKDTETIENIFESHNSKTQLIYIITLFTIVALVISLPIIKVNISIQGTGVIRPIIERTEVKASVSEIIENIYVKENDLVKEGSLILSQRTANIDSKIFFIQFQKAETESFIHDLAILTGTKEPTGLGSLVYVQEYSYYLQQKNELQNKLDKALKELERNKTLYNNGVIPEKEYDDFLFQAKTASNEYQILVDNKKSKWEAELNHQTVRLNELNSQINQLTREKELYSIKAPVNGTIEQFSGYYVGSSINAGQVIAVISPDSSLQAEIYIPTRDIGYITNQTEVKIQVDAFNYNEWGVLSGKITQISSDYIVIENIPMFRVRCSFDKNCLSLNNGTKGYLRKGMNIRARFIISKRSLFHLLYQKTDKWINPTQY